MDWLQFAATVIGHLAWPSVIIVLLVLLRKHVGALADRLEEFSFGGAKFIWKKTLQEGREIIEHLPGLPPPKEEAPKQRPKPEEPKTNVPRERKSTLNVHTMSSNSLWRVTTVGSIVTNYQSIEAILFDIGDALGVDAAQPRSVMNTLISKGLIRAEIADLFNTLRMGRNVVVHENANPSPEEAQEFAQQADLLRNTLLTIKAGIENGNK